MDRLQRELGASGANGAGAWPKTVVFLEGVECFYEFCRNLFRDGGTADEAIAILSARVDWEKARGGDVVRALHALGIGKKQKGDLAGAMATYEECKRVHIANGTLQTENGLALLTDMGDGGKATFDPQPNEIYNNFIIANYGAGNAGMWVLVCPCVL